MSCATKNYGDFYVKKVRSGLRSRCGKMMPIRPDPQRMLLKLMFIHIVNDAKLFFTPSFPCIRSTVCRRKGCTWRISAVMRRAASSLTSRPSRSGWTWAWGKAGQSIILFFVLLTNTVLYMVLRIRDGFPGSEFFHLGSRIRSKEFRMFNHKNCF